MHAGKWVEWWRWSMMATINSKRRWIPLIFPGILCHWNFYIEKLETNEQMGALTSHTIKLRLINFYGSIFLKIKFRLIKSRIFLIHHAGNRARKQCATENTVWSKYNCWSGSFGINRYTKMFRSIIAATSISVSAQLLNKNTNQM